MEKILPSIFRLARSVRLHSDYDIKVGAVIVKKGKPLAVGFNQRKTHPQVRWTIHAERDALMTCDEDQARGSTIYIYREHSDGSPALASPCIDCRFYLANAGVTKIIYTTNEYPFFKEERLK